MKILFLVAVLVASASAHLCLIGPHQRGTMSDINTYGAGDCNLEKPAPCGDRPESKTPNIIFDKGTNVSITFQKNLDHFNAANPGSFVVNLWYEGKNQHELVSIKDSADAKSGYLYTPMVTIPQDATGGKAILQVIYMTNNPQAPPNFYQCADVMIK